MTSIQTQLVLMNIYPLLSITMEGYLHERDHQGLATLLVPLLLFAAVHEEGTYSVCGPHPFLKLRCQAHSHGRLFYYALAKPFAHQSQLLLWLGLTYHHLVSIKRCLVSIKRCAVPVSWTCSQGISHRVVRHALRMMLGPPCSPRAFVVVAALFLAVFFLTVSRLHHGSPSLAGGWVYSLVTPGNNGYGCSSELDFLRQPELALNGTIVYSRRCIKPVRGDVDRDAVVNITHPLITRPTVVDLAAGCPTATLPSCEPISLQVPPAYPEKQYRHLLFGVASTYERINDSLPAFAHWLAGTGARLVAVVSDAETTADKFNLTALEDEYRKRDILATVIPPRLKKALPRKNDGEITTDNGGSAPVEQLHFMLIRDMLDAASDETRWLGLLDDDTFFPALYPLDQELQRHDHTRPAWLGALADNFDSIKKWGYMAYGGAGVFLSVPLARQLAPHLEACVRETTVASGDGMLRDCVYARTTTKLTLVPGLYQLDIAGDPSGFFESGRRPLLSLHHWKSWYRAPVDRMAAVARVCGDCFLQRWRFGPDTLLANGYSISTYRDGLDSVDLGRVEGTWQDADDDDKFNFVYGPFRPRLGEEQKKSYRLATSGWDGAGAFRQVYVHRAPKGEGEGEEKSMDEVVELVWEA
ncbi:hypothetical protein VTK56DRAFT_9722 [Thermocarpiscus australiensis]